MQNVSPPIPHHGEKTARRQTENVAFSPPKRPICGGGFDIIPLFPTPYYDNDVNHPLQGKVNNANFPHLPHLPKHKNRPMEVSIGLCRFTRA